MPMLGIPHITIEHKLRHVLQSLRIVNEVMLNNKMY